MNKTKNTLIYILMHLEYKLYTPKKYALGLCRDVGHYIHIYPILFRISIIIGLIYSIWHDTLWEMIIAKIFVAIFYYCLLRLIIPRKFYPSS